MKASLLYLTVLVALGTSQPPKTLLHRAPPGGIGGEAAGLVGDGWRKYGANGFDYSLRKKPVDQPTSNGGKGFGDLAAGEGDGRIRAEYRTSTIPFNPDPYERRNGRLPHQPPRSNLRTTCLKRGLGLCGPSAQAIKKSPSWRRLQAARPRRVRITGARGAQMAAVTILAPFAHDVLDAVKSWDNVIGVSVKWFDNLMASLQESVGGRQVPEIHGNELKLRFICWMRGKQRHKNDVDHACDRLKEKDRLQDLEMNRPTLERDMTDGLNRILQSCEDLLDHPPDDEVLLAKLVERCDALLSEAAAVTGRTKDGEPAKKAKSPCVAAKKTKKPKCSKAPMPKWKQASRIRLCLECSLLRGL